jgi:hypothetical protein
LENPAFATPARGRSNQADREVADNSFCAAGPQVNLYDVAPNAGSMANLTLTQTGWTPLGAYTAQDVTDADNCALTGTSPQDIATVANTGSTEPGEFNQRHHQLHRYRHQRKRQTPPNLSRDAAASIRVDSASHRIL